MSSMKSADSRVGHPGLMIKGSTFNDFSFTGRDGKEEVGHWFCGAALTHTSNVGGMLSQYCVGSKIKELEVFGAKNPGLLLTDSTFKVEP